MPYTAHAGVLISPQSDREGNKLKRQKILIFIYPIYNHNWRNINTIYIKQHWHQKKYSHHKKVIHREVGWVKDLSALLCIYTGVLISPQSDQEGDKLQRQKILIFIYPIYNHNWRNIYIYIYIYIYKTRLASKEIFSPSKKNTLGSRSG